MTKLNKTCFRAKTELQLLRERYPNTDQKKLWIWTLFTHRDIGTEMHT